MKRFVLLVGPIVLGLGLVAAVRATERGDRMAQVDPGEPSVVSTPAATPAPVAAATGRLAAADAAQPTEVDHARDLALPDGTFVPALNDAVDAAPLQDFWGPQPYSAIVGVERSSAGVDWYRHADGSYSTTQMVWRSDLGRFAAMTRVAHPGPAPKPAAH